MTAPGLHALLLGVRTVSLSAEGSTDGPEWRRSGGGRVTTAAIAPDTIEWEESGSWSEGATSIPYRNRLQWRIDGEELHLAHCRRGSEAPTHLLTLVTNDDGALIPRTPHRCGADRYALTVVRTGGAVTLEWRVDGPHKAYRLTTTYR